MAENNSNIANNSSLNPEDIEDIFDTTKKILNLEKEIKDIREDIKILKAEAKDRGVPVALLNKAIKKTKEEIKEKADLTKSEVQFLMKLLDENAEIKSLIESLTNG